MRVAFEIFLDSLFAILIFISDAEPTARRPMGSRGSALSLEIKKAHPRKNQVYNLGK